MNLKNLLKALFAFVFGVVLFASCEKDPVIDNGDGSTSLGEKPAYVASDKVYLCGNCTSSDLSSATMMGYGDGEEHTFGGATLLTLDQLLDAGYYVVGVRVYIGDEVESGNVFIGTDYENPEVVKDFTYTKGGWQYVMFDAPYDFKEDTYIGFKATGKTDFMAFEPAKKLLKTEMIFIDGNWNFVSSELKGKRYVWAMQAIVVGGNYSAERQHDVVLERPAMLKNPKEGEVIPLSCEVRGAGIVPAENVKVKCTFGNETRTIVLPNKLMNGQSTLVEFKDIVAPSIDGGSSMETVKFEVEYEEDVLNSNNKAEISCFVYTSEAVDRNAVLIEQFTGQDCPNCPSGAKALVDAISGLENPEQAVWVAHHTYYVDTFSLQESAVIAQVLQANFAPACNLNRIPCDYVAGDKKLIWNPSFTTTSLLERSIAEYGLATIDINRIYNPETRELDLEISGVSLSDNSYITVIVTQSGIKDRQAGVTGVYVHNNAPRSFLSAAKGDALELDGLGNYKVTYKYKVPEAINNIVCVPEDMDVVVFVHGNIGRTATRMVYNADKVPFIGDKAQSVMRAMSLYKTSSMPKLRIYSEEYNY